MSSIFNGNSIYNVGGGGGGGYKDGGELVDGEYIEVENNTASNYENTSRNEINFVVPIEDGEIIDSVVDLTTDQNATINVYYYLNGFYYLLGYVGNNTVTAGNSYKINITFKSFNINLVNEAPKTPELVEIDGQIFPVLKVGNVLWSKTNLNIAIPGTYVVQDSHVPGHSSEYYYQISQHDAIDTFLRSKNCRLPTSTDIYNLSTLAGGDSVAGGKLKSTQYWYDGGNGTDEFGFNALPCSTTSGGPIVNYVNMQAQFLGIDRGFTMSYSSNDLGGFTNMNLPYFISVRFVMDLT